jgi:YhgE/Pip-like protein
MLTVEDLKDLKGKKVYVRVDFNVPQKDGVIRDNNRIKAALPTITYLTGKGARVILMSHLGKIKWKEPDPAKIEAMKKANDMAPVAKALQELVPETKVSFCEATRGEQLKAAVEALHDGDILLGQNTRYEKGEEKNDPELAKEWASLADVFVMDAFGSSHRTHASTVGVPSILKAEGKPVAEGYLMIKEVENLTRCVEVKEEDVGQINQYGVSFTPLFISIGLWVGALMCYVVLFYDQEHRFKFLDKKNRGIKQSVAYIGIAAGFGLITAFLLKNLIGFSVNDVALYYFGSVLTAMTFMSIIQCFIALFDDVGKFLALIILVLQLAAAGGTFPIETVDAGFRWLSPLLPMTYSINLFKEGIVSTTEGFAGANIYALVAFMAVSFIITVIRYSVKRKD